MVKEDAKKGPWTEQEDVQLVFYVKLFGDRRWDFIANVSGLKVAGDRSIHRLRWVNYLNPGLKRGKMTANEEKLVVELHKKWGNRWSRIARKLPGRTDNEIKNYWRTHMRKEAQEKRKKGISSSSSSSNSSSSSSGSKSPTVESTPGTETKECSFYDMGGLDFLVDMGKKKAVLELEDGSNTMDEIFNYLDFNEGNCNLTYQTVASPIWDYCPNDTLWTMDENESKMFMQPMGDLFHSFPFCNNMIG
ncbi:transcription factor MYB59-like isoform X1 [Primulina eburnea]|uniref:transcription factor MYB59-like isoform X1 n=1 Tax=Primulina eburnea TaxID=1245227 RepID=UPI003C6BE890